MGKNDKIQLIPKWLSNIAKLGGVVFALHLLIPVLLLYTTCSRGQEVVECPVVSFPKEVIVTATMYEPVPTQTDDTPNLTADGTRINVKYAGNPLWVNGSDQTNPFDVYSNSLNVKSSGIKRNGRKSWSLKFSYVSDSDLFSSNPRASSYIDPSVDTSNYNSDDIADDTTYKYNIDTDDSFVAQVWNKAGMGIPFIFQPDSNDRDDFYICKFDQSSLKVSQVAYKVYDVSLKIVEVW